MMARRDDVREVHHTSGGGSFGVLGVIIGALLVAGAIFFFAGGPEMFADRGGGSGPSVTVNTPSGGSPGTRPVTPSAPATTGSGQAR
jgi:predicted phage tail protein